MSYRDIVVTITILACLPYAFLRPFFGLLLFSWLAYMRPQDLCWGFAKQFRFSLLVAICMYGGWFFLETRRFTRWSTPLKWLSLFTVCLTISLLVNERHGEDRPFSKWFDLMKVFLVAFFTVGMVDDQKRLRMILWTITLSLGFYGVKCGLHTLLLGGRILQGPGGMMLDNNDLCLAMAMNLPLFFYMGRSSPRRWVRRLCYVAVGLTCITVVATVSRGGFLTMCLAGLMILSKIRRGVMPWLLAGVAALLVLFALPQDMEKRLATLKDPSAESSAAGRLYAWKVGLRMVAHNPMFGVGFEGFLSNFRKYDPITEGMPSELRHVIVAHNTYVQVWAELGTPAFACFLAMLGSAILLLRRTRRQAQRHGGLPWVQSYADMLEVSLVCFVFGATFLNRAHFDLIYHLVAVSVALSFIARSEAQTKAAEPEALEAAPSFALAPRPWAPWSTPQVQ